MEYNEITDSGKRETFDTGSQRDTRENKGRFDLIPAEPMFRLARHYELGALKYTDNNWKLGQKSSRYLDSALRHLFCYMRGDRSEDHLSACVFNCFAIEWNEECFPDMHDLDGEQVRELKEITQEEWDEAKQKQGLKKQQ